jgi:foldase protein PrsA
MFNHFSEAALNSQPAVERLAAPKFSACISHLQSEAAAIDQPALSESQLRSECDKRYRTVLQGAMERLISDEWLIGGARELGVAVGEQGTLETRAQLASEAIRRAVVDRVAPVTQAQIKAYYRHHKLGYLLLAKRDLKIARTATEASAAKVRAEVASGRSFASVVKKLPIGQPIDSGDGLVLELQPDAYGEPNLNKAIFTAQPGVLRGPIDTWFGWFVFEVTKITAERVKPLAEVQQAIRQDLLHPLQQHALAAFNTHWIAVWTARTDCGTADVVPKCRQFKATPAKAS